MNNDMREITRNLRSVASPERKKGYARTVLLYLKKAGESDSRIRSVLRRCALTEPEIRELFRAG